MNLLDDEELERSAVVANCRMNRERDLLGSNGYDRELGFNPLGLLKERVASARTAAWLDLCCGTGKALIRAARSVHAEGLSSRIEILGVWSPTATTCSGSQARTFEGFFQVDGTHRETGEGYGLGLAVARRMADLMGGKLTVASEPGAGSTFTLTLPSSVLEETASLTAGAGVQRALSWRPGGSSPPAS